MNWDDLKEKFQSEFKAQWEKFQESSLFIQTKERYENLTPTMQKVAVVVVCLLGFYLAVSVPLSYFSHSQEATAEFEDKRQLIRDLLKATRQAQETPDIAVPPGPDALKMQIDGQIQAAHLLPEQIISTEVSQEKPALIKGDLSQGLVKVSLSKLNVRQVVDLGHQFQSINSSVKMTDMVMEANTQDSRYYDVVYKLAVLAVPALGDPTADLEPSKAGPPPPKKKGNK